MCHMARMELRLSLLSTLTLLLAPDQALAATGHVSISSSALLQLNTDMTLPHQGIPLGVPTSYDWQAYPKIGAWNTPPSGYTAMTAWGQVFWNSGIPITESLLQLKGLQTLMCNSVTHTWSQIQTGGIAGAQFNADYSGNTSTPASTFTQSGNTYTIGFQQGPYAFQFWPIQGRASIPTTTSCGYVVLVQARALPINTSTSIYTGNFLIGLGGDYWVDTTSAWNNYQTNTDIAIGRLKVIGLDWVTFGLSTASDADLNNLYTYGYTI